MFSDRVIVYVLIVHVCFYFLTELEKKKTAEAAVF